MAATGLTSTYARRKLTNARLEAKILSFKQLNDDAYMNNQ